MAPSLRQFTSHRFRQHEYDDSSCAVEAESMTFTPAANILRVEMAAWIGGPDLRCHNVIGNQHGLRS